MTAESLEDFVRRGDPDRYLSSLTAPAEDRQKLHILYAFNIEASRIPWAASTPELALARFNWWYHCVGDLNDSARTGNHWLMADLAELVNATGCTADPLVRILESRCRELEPLPFANYTEFESYIEGTSSEMMWLAARLLGATNDAEDTVRQYGWAVGVANFLRAVPKLEAGGRMMVNWSAISPNEVVGEATRRLENARLSRSIVPRRVRPALIAGWRVDAALRRVELGFDRVAEGRLDEPMLAKWLAFLTVLITGRW